MRPRPLVLAAALAVVALGAVASSEPAKVPDTGVRTLEIEIEKTAARLAVLAELTTKSAAELAVRAYVRYRVDELADPKKEVTVDELWEEVVRKSTDEVVRGRAVDAIVGHEALDPDLALEPGKGAKRPRAKFSLKVAKDLLEGDDRVLQTLANRLLVSLWPRFKDDPDILNYNPNDRRTWQEAKRRWDRLLQR